MFNSPHKHTQVQNKHAILGLNMKSFAWKCAQCLRPLAALKVSTHEYWHLNENMNICREFHQSSLSTKCPARGGVGQQEREQEQEHWASTWWSFEGTKACLDVAYSGYIFCDIKNAFVPHLCNL